jgi:hypothetical protein
MKFTKNTLTSLTVACLLLTGSFATKASAEDYADARVPQIKFVDIQFISENASVYAISNLEVKVSNNAIKRWRIDISTPDSYSPSALVKPCQPFYGAMFETSNRETNKIVKLQGKTLVSSVYDFKYCLGAYQAVGIVLFDEAHTISLNRECLTSICTIKYIPKSDPSWNWVVTATALAEAPNQAECPIWKTFKAMFLACNQQTESLQAIEFRINESFVADLLDKAAADKAAADKAAADKAAADKAAADKAAAVTKKQTITCTKGKIIKQVSGQFPKCPTGFKKK